MGTRFLGFGVDLGLIGADELGDEFWGHQLVLEAAQDARLDSLAGDGLDWLIRTNQIAARSCDYGCLCESNAPPTWLPCEEVMALEITEGHFENVPLNGLRAAGVCPFP
jgi:hypothetical protein